MIEHNLRFKFENTFGIKPDYFAESSGRFEVIGNHTDHNGGCCIASACNLKIFGAVSKRSDDIINIFSEGYSSVHLNLRDLSINESEKFSSSALVRGIAKYFLNKNFKICGFNLLTSSTIFKGAGVSSSAAFELLVSTIFNVLANDSKIDSVTLAKAGQFAENYYFGKKSGLLDQTSIALGDTTFLNFKNDEIEYESLKWNFDNISIVLVNTGGSHADLSDLYSNIPLKMKSAARKMGHDRLIDCDSSDVEKSNLTQEERDFAYHFYQENERVQLAKNAIISKNKIEFYKLINESRKSSRNLLKNMEVKGSYEGSPLEACDFVMSILCDKGACKINGGGFAGSIICFMDKEKESVLLDKVSKKYGNENISLITINSLAPFCKKF